MRPLDFYFYAVRLAADATTEAEYRSAISRLYYGLHHEACCRYFRSHTGAAPLVRGRRHSELRERIHTLQSPTSSDISKALGMLMRIREQADYEIGSPIRIGSMAPDQTLAQALILAKELLPALDRYSPGAAPDRCRCPVVWSAR